MRRVTVPIKGAIPGDPRTGQSYFTKPGTPLDRVIKAERKAQLEAAYIKYGVKAPRVNTGNREKVRNAKRSGRSLATAVSGHVLDGPMGLGPNY